MEVFYACSIEGGFARLDAGESAHLVRVLRHRDGDAVDVIDGCGTLYRCTLTDASPAGAVARIDSAVPGWGAHPYRLTLAVCPTKNIDRYEWMAEKATELGVDCIVPVIGERSERRLLKTERLRRIVLSAAKQSLKGAVPEIAEPVSVREFVASESGCPESAQPPEKSRLSPDSATLPAPAGASLALPEGTHSREVALRRSPGISSDPLALRLIAYCSDEVQPRASIMEMLQALLSGDPTCAPAGAPPALPEGTHSRKVAPCRSLGQKPLITVLIGPEGDFSPEEVRAAMAAGFVPVHLGPSRLRTETAAVTAAEAVYLSLGLRTEMTASGTAEPAAFVADK